jgi:hypothetical protein
MLWPLLLSTVGPLKTMHYHLTLASRHPQIRRVEDPLAPCSAVQGTVGLNSVQCYISSTGDRGYASGLLQEARSLQCRAVTLDSHVYITFIFIKNSTV